MIEIETRCRIPIWGTFGRIQWQSHLPHCRVLPPGEFNGMSSQIHVSHCRVLPLDEFAIPVMIQEPHDTLQGAVTWRNQCHDRATLQGVRIPSGILKIVFRHIFFRLFNAVWALKSGGFRIVSDTLVIHVKIHNLHCRISSHI